MQSSLHCLCESFVDLSSNQKISGNLGFRDSGIESRICVFILRALIFFFQIIFMSEIISLSPMISPPRKGSDRQYLKESVLRELK